MMRLPLILLGLGALLPAQPALSLHQAVQTALDTHPALVSAQRRIEVTRGQIRQASLRPNPVAFFQLEGVRGEQDGYPFVFGKDIDAFALVQQTVETAGRRGKRVDAATLAVQQMELALATRRRDIGYSVRIAYWEAAGAQRYAKLLEQILENFNQIVEYHRLRVQEGAMAEADLMRVRLELDRIQLNAIQAKYEAVRSRVLLFQAMGQSTFDPVELTEPLEVQPGETPIRGAAEEALKQRPEVASAELNISLARAGLQLQEAQAKPTYDWIAGYKRYGPFNTFVGGLTFQLPVANRNQGNLASAASEIKFAEADLAARRALVAAEVEAARTEYELRRVQVTETLVRLRQQAAEVSETARNAYRLGGADLLRLLDAERLRIDIDQQNVLALVKYRQSIALYQQALGVQP